MIHSINGVPVHPVVASAEWYGLLPDANLPGRLEPDGRYVTIPTIITVPGVGAFRRWQTNYGVMVWIFSEYGPAGERLL